MSAEATGWVWKHSPYTATSLGLHLAIADVVNDLHAHEFWMSQAGLAAKARCSRETANRWLGTACDDGFLTLIEDNRKSGKPSRFRFLMPAVDVVYSSIRGVTNHHTPLVDDPSKGVTDHHTGCDDSSQGGVTDHHTEQGHELKGTQNLLDDAAASPSSPPSSATRIEKDKPGFRSEVDELCTLLCDLIVDNGSKRPNVNDAWRRECRLLIDRDQRSPEQVEIIIQWCQQDAFWHKNILSMDKLRKQFDRLRLARNEEIEKRGAKPEHTPRADEHAGADWMSRSRTGPIA